MRKSELSLTLEASLVSYAEYMRSQPRWNVQRIRTEPFKAHTVRAGLTYAQAEEFLLRYPHRDHHIIIG